MADIKQIQVDGTTYNIKDEVARQQLETKQPLIESVSSTYEENGGSPSAVASTDENGNLAFNFQNLKLKFSDLTNDDKEAIRGPQGATVAYGAGDLVLDTQPGKSQELGMTQKAITDAVYTYKDDVEELELDEVDEDKFVKHTDGNLYNSDYYCHTDYIDISGYDAIIYGRTISTTSSTQLGMAFYDENKDYVSGQQAKSEAGRHYVRTTIDIPSGAVYVRLSVAKDKYSYGEQYIYGVYKDALLEPKIVPIDERTSALEDRIDEDMYESFESKEEQVFDDLHEVSDGKAINYDAGNLYSSNNYHHTDYLEIGQYQSIIYGRTTTTNSSSGLGIAFYDSLYNYISGQQAIVGSVAKNEYTLTEKSVPEGAKYVRLSVGNASSFGSQYLIGVSRHTGKRTKLETLEEEIDSLEDNVEILDARVSAIEGSSGLSEQKVVLSQNDICYGYQIAADGSITSGNSRFGCTSYIYCKGAGTIIYNNVVTNDSSLALSIGLAFYDSQKQFLSFQGLSQGDSEGYVSKTLTVPQDAYYLRATYWDGENYPNGIPFHAEFISNYAVYNGKREAVGDYIYFTVPVNQAVDAFWNTNVDASQLPINIKDTTGVLLLPPSYKKNGEKTKLIINFHGNSHFVKYGQWGKQSGSEGFLLQKQRWANAGYAVLDCNNWKYTLEDGQSGLGSRQSMEAYRKCFEWVLQNYNIDERPFIVCGSAGGPTGINCCYSWPDVRAAVWLDCWTDLNYPFGLGASYRSYFVELFGFSSNSASAWDSNAYKVKNYNPISRVITIDETLYINAPKCPVKVLWLTSGLNNGFYDALKNGGGIVSVRKVTGISHSDLVSGGDGTNANSANIDSEIIAWLNSY